MSNQAHNTDNSPVTGQLELRVYRNGKPILHSIERNLVVRTGKELLTAFLSGTGTPGPITKFRVGTGTAEPVSADTDLDNAVNITTGPDKAIDGVEFPAPNQVRFNFSLGSAEANGNALTEFGLFTAGNVMFARKKRNSPINKSSDITISFSWTITF